jgi:cysteinyl-tRNA synthetase
VAQSEGSCGHAPANYWLHTNMLLLNGKKMSKSDGNTITPEQLFLGESEHIEKGYTPMALRFFMLQAHYRSPLDITDHGLESAEKGFRRLMDNYKVLESLTPHTEDFDGSESATDRALLDLIEAAYSGMDDDFNTAVALAALNEIGSYFHKIANKQLDAKELAPWVLERLKTVYHNFIFDIFGLKEEAEGGSDGTVDGLMSLILDIRANARAQKDFGMSDKIRDALAEVGIAVKDGKEGVSWAKG